MSPWLAEAWSSMARPTLGPPWQPPGGPGMATFHGLLKGFARGVINKTKMCSCWKYQVLTIVCFEINQTSFFGTNPLWRYINPHKFLCYLLWGWVIWWVGLGYIQLIPSYISISAPGSHRYLGPPVTRVLAEDSLVRSEGPQAAQSANIGTALTANFPHRNGHILWGVKLRHTKCGACKPPCNIVYHGTFWYLLPFFPREGEEAVIS